MTIAQLDSDITALVPSSEETIVSLASAGGVVVLLNLADMSGTDELLVRHYVAFDGAGNTCVGSRSIVHGTTTDDTWDGTAGSATAEGWESWPMGFGNGGGFITLEAISGTFDVEWIALDLGGPTG